jgi:hypothetical protein
MKRAIKWLTVSVAVIAVLWFGGEFALTAWIAHKMNDEAHSMHEGHVIVDEIKAHDKTINANWSTSEGRALVRIYGVTDVNRQDMVLAWAKSLKERGRITRPVKVAFYERENMITTVDSKGFSGGHRGPELEIRAVMF